ncbi:MAG: hypothetical protein H6536_08100 [Bacteroidales bacterium]|nr:hypothetical protein [Bacteroidales bacterium]
MRRAKIYLAIVAFILLARRFLSASLLRFLRRIKRKYRLQVSLFSTGANCFANYTSTILVLFFSPLSLGLQLGYLVRFLRI